MALQILFTSGWTWWYIIRNQTNTQLFLFLLFLYRITRNYYWTWRVNETVFVQQEERVKLGIQHFRIQKSQCKKAKLSFRLYKHDQISIIYKVFVSFFHFSTKNTIILKEKKVIKSIKWKGKERWRWSTRWQVAWFFYQRLNKTTPKAAFSLARHATRSFRRSRPWEVIEQATVDQRRLKATRLLLRRVSNRWNTSVPYAERSSR